MKLVDLFSGKFRGGRAESSPLTRTQAGGKATKSGTMGADTSQGEMYSVGMASQETIMPHNVFGEEALDDIYPPIEVPEAVDAEDPLDDEQDCMYKAGMNTVDDLMYHLSVQGRRRRLAQDEGPVPWVNLASKHRGGPEWPTPGLRAR